MTEPSRVDADVQWDVEDGLIRARLPEGLGLKPGDRILAGGHGSDDVPAVVQRFDAIGGVDWVLFRPTFQLEPGDVGYEPKPPSRPGSRGKLAHLAHLAHPVDLTEDADTAWDTLEDRTPTDWVKASVVDGLVFEIRELRRQVREARMWAWSLEHRWAAPQLMGVALYESGDMVEPGWLSSPVPYWEVDGTDSETLSDGS